MKTINKSSEESTSGLSDSRFGYGSPNSGDPNLTSEMNAARLEKLRARYESGRKRNRLFEIAGMLLFVITGASCLFCLFTMLHR